MAPQTNAGGRTSLVSILVDDLDPTDDGAEAVPSAPSGSEPLAVDDDADRPSFGRPEDAPEFDQPGLDLDTESAHDRRVRFNAAVEEFMQPLYGNALRLTGNPHDASDLVQATFERAYKAFHQYRPGTNLKAWLFKIQSNTFINDYRKKQRQPKVADSDQVEDWQMHRAGSHTSVGLRSAETEVLETLPEQAIIEALDQLSDDYRQAVLLADVEGLRYKEIAEIMGTPVGTVMSRLHRGRRQLRGLLEEHARSLGYLRGVDTLGDES
jgi:RNA polymerase sigma-70 factor (ECF subfamily)